MWNCATSCAACMELFLYSHVSNYSIFQLLHKVSIVSLQKRRKHYRAARVDMAENTATSSENESFMTRQRRESRRLVFFFSSSAKFFLDIEFLLVSSIVSLSFLGQTD